MDVNVLFKDKIKIDDDKNFNMTFKNGKEVISVLLNKKRDYFLTNAVIHLNSPKNDTTDKELNAIKELEKEAKKHIEMEKKNDLGLPFPKTFMAVFGSDHYRTSFKPVYYFKLNETEIKDFFKTYKYYNIEKEKEETFNAYSLSTHLKYLKYTKTTTK